MWDIFLNQADGEYPAGFDNGSSLGHTWGSDAMLRIEQINSFKGVEHARSKSSKSTCREIGCKK